jgi:hypothetical protein
MSLFHAPLDLNSVADRIGRGPRSEPMPRSIAVVAGGDHIRTMLTAVLLSQQVLARGLQAGGLAQGEPVRGSEAGAIS